MVISTTVIAIAAIIIIFLLFLAVRGNKMIIERNNILKEKENIIDDYKNRFDGVIDADEELNRVLQDIQRLENKSNELKSNYQVKRNILDKLIKEVSLYENDLDMIEQGFYKPQFDFDTSETYKIKIAEIKQKQKQMISDKQAISCTTQWTVGDSRAEGKKMVNKAIRLTARAFNNECDACIAKVSWNNVNNMISRIKKSFEAINKLNESNCIVISRIYLDLKLSELKLAYEYQENKKQEKDEQAEIKRQMREEAKLEKEMAQALKDEEQYQKLLEKAKNEAKKATGEKLDKLNEKIFSLTAELEEAHAKSERAKSMAEQTKVGHVYVISNIGSFGKNVYKIGMTRRLEPLDRVKELGDASVPFTFDVHAMIYSDDAPALENALHKSFDEKRLNLVNNRKEFFDVALSDIEAEVQKISPDAEFIVTSEAREYRESQAIRKQREEKEAEPNALEAFPEAI